MVAISAGSSKTGTSRISRKLFIESLISKPYCYMIQNMIQKWQDKTQSLLVSLRSYRPDGLHLAIVALLVSLMVLLALPFTTPADLVAIAEGDLSACWQLWAILLLGAALSGFGAGVLETTKHEDLLATLPDSEISTLITRAVSRLVRTVVALAVNCPAAPLVVVARVSQKFNPFISLRLPLLTPDLWPTGPSPRLIYEPA